MRECLSQEVKEHFQPLEDARIDLDKVKVLEVRNLWFCKRYLYEIPDAYHPFGGERPVHVYYYEKRPCVPTVNCTDILGGVMKQDSKGKWHANLPISFINSMACVIFKGWNAFTVCTDNKQMFTDGAKSGNGVEEFQLSLEDVAANNVQALQLIKSLENTSSEIYAIGVSLGALTMGAIVGLDESYKKAVLILCGYPLHEIIATSSEGMVRDFFSQMYNKYGVTQGEMKKRLGDAIAMSNRLYDCIPGPCVFQVIAEGDTSMPTSAQKALRDKVKPVKVYNPSYISWLWGQFKNGHYQMLLKYPVLLIKSLSFLSKKTVAPE